MAKKQHCYPFPRPALSVDIVLFRESPELEVLLVRRKKAPFKGSWAFPGGFVEKDEPLESAAKRELEEETGVSKVRLRQLEAFGDPGRDPRGHTVTVVFTGTTRPGTRPHAGDDAADSDWFPAARTPRLAFDHRKILRRALASLKEEK